MTITETVKAAYDRARDHYDTLEINTEAALEALDATPISIPCWQGDDVQGFEPRGEGLTGGGIQVTGNYRGRARTVADLRADLAQALAWIPGGPHRVNLHAIYGEFEAAPYPDRDALVPAHFQGWMDWAKQRGLGLDFNATCFAHPKADADGMTLASVNTDTRAFWIAHVNACRQVAAAMGEYLQSAVTHNLWIPDGMKDAPVNRAGHREQLRESLDVIYNSHNLDRTWLHDSVESKLFGIGSEAFVVGSHEFYLAYTLTRDLMLCLDLGHFHPTESVADKVSAVLAFMPDLLLHVSRGVRWDSDHVCVLDDNLLALMQEIVRANALGKVHIALDFFDATINRVAAWAIGTRATQQALLRALLEPTARLQAFEHEGNFTARLGLLEVAKTLPFGAVWDYYCASRDVPVGVALLAEFDRYDETVLAKRG